MTVCQLLKATLSIGLTCIPLFIAANIPPSGQAGTVETSFQITSEYSFGAQGVWVQHRQPQNCTVPPPAPKPNVIDISPATCVDTCYPGSFQPPEKEHCNKIVNSLLANSTGSLHADPNSWVYVYYKSCVAVFENPEHNTDAIEYNWALLGNTVGGLFSNCLNYTAVDSIGGACLFGDYRGYNLRNVVVTLQRLAEFEEKEEE